MVVDFLRHLLDHRSIILLFVFGVCLLGYGYPAYKTTETRRVSWFWFVLGVLAIVAWFYFMFFNGG